MSLQLSEIFIYPIKSLGGISLNNAVVEQRGLQYDRRMMLVDETGMFLTQRDFPQMALLKTEIINDELFIHHSVNKQSISIPLRELNQYSRKIKVTIWDDECSALIVSDEANEFFSDILNTNCSLVYMPDEEKRIVDPAKKYVTDEHIVSFADSYPFLIIGQSSLDELNRKMPKSLPINRFRPNFVFVGGKPFEEDSWKDFLIGEIKFKAVKPCERCIITTTNQDTAERNEEPLKTLSTFRRPGNKVLFGVNLVACGIGKIRVGDQINLI
ncbi:MOSC N-terminal beta barrel domain-containing protein [Ignavibacterium sp.]|uniref:MOSC domain-containing protein n=1 Tax=Ignavibacterium sp. TaxID=2651167 RepID=UPI00307D50E8